MGRVGMPDSQMYMQIYTNVKSIEGVCILHMAEKATPQGSNVQLHRLVIGAKSKGTGSCCMCVDPNTALSFTANAAAHSRSRCDHALGRSESKTSVPQGRLLCLTPSSSLIGPCNDGAVLGSATGKSACSSTLDAPAGTNAQFATPALLRAGGSAK